MASSYTLWRFDVIETAYDILNNGKFINFIVWYKIFETPFVFQEQ